MSRGVDTFIENTLGGAIDTTHTDIAVECPKCGRAKMYMHREKGLAFCHYCEYKANLARLIYDVTGTPFEIAQLQARAILRGAYKEAAATVSVSEILSRLIEGARKQVIEKIKVLLPERAVPITRTLGARYLMGRGFDMRLLAPYRLLYCPAVPQFEPTNNHVIFPDYSPENGDLIYWTTRAAYEPKNGHKSYNPKGIPRRGVLYGLFAVRSDTLILCEGPLDAVACGGCAILGKHLTEDQAIMASRYFTRAVICLDADAKPATLRSAAILQDLGVDVRVTFLAAKDPAASPIKGEALHRFIIDNAQSVKGSALIRMKLKEGA